MPGASHNELPQAFLYRGWTIRYSSGHGKHGHNDTRAPVTWVVFVHGTPWCSDVFQPVATALRATGRFNTVVYDLPGYGQSQEFDAAWADSDVADTSVKNGGHRPLIVAHDIAGVISMRAHLLHGCEYESLCLLDTNCVLPWGDKLYNLVRSNPDVFKQLPPRVFEGALRAIIESARFDGHQGLGPEWVDILARPWLIDETSPSRGLGYATPQDNFVRQIQQADDSHTAELLERNRYAEVRCPVKILWGEKDEWIPVDKIEKLAGMLGDRLEELVRIPDAGHLVMLDQPAMVTLEIGRWLEKKS
ncbi:hypothetical protein LQW54_008156 [Pestalotiopsis sp. IQ-011]